MLADTQITAGPMDRLDRDVLSDVNNALQGGGVHASDFKSVEAEVRQGAVTLRGHVHSVMHKRNAELRTVLAPGVNSVDSELIADSELEVAVAQALAADPLTRTCILPVGASEGWIQLGGEVPDAQVLAAAEAVAAAVPGVRGVLGLPHVAGGPRNANRRALQPRVGAAVYSDDGQIGRVAKVIINPRNRLVSHIVVNVHLDVGRREVRGLFVIPVGAIRLTTSTGTTLHETSRDVSTRPEFGEADFRFAPAAWQPPFPYAPDMVRWPAARAV